MKLSLIRALVGVMFYLSIKESVESLLVIILGAGKWYVGGKIFGLVCEDTNEVIWVIYVGWNDDSIVGKYLVLEVVDILEWRLEKEKSMLIDRSVGRIYFSDIWMVFRFEELVLEGVGKRVGKE